MILSSKLEENLVKKKKKIVPLKELSSSGRGWNYYLLFGIKFDSKVIESIGPYVFC